MPEITIRSLRPDDFDRVAEIESRITGRPRKVFLEKRLAMATGAPEYFIACAAVEGEKLMGYGIARLYEGDFGNPSAVAVLDTVGVDPDAQGRGIGKAILSGIEQRMKRKNIHTLRTQAVWSNQRVTGFFSSADLKLAPIQVIERDTSPLGEKTAEVKSVKMDGMWRVHRGTGNDYESLSRDRMVIRSLKENDLAAVVRIDEKLIGFDRSAYYGAKFKEMLTESGIRVSLVAEDDGMVAGFIMARVDFGEFGKVEKAAVIDTVGVHPAYWGNGIGHALLSQLLVNLATLQVETVSTLVRWEDFVLQRFLLGCGFGPSQRLVLSKTID
ncbi:MAG TPA: GNAT family N-acetyltransferase [Geopsychrobacteraceae bacterium]